MKKGDMVESEFWPCGRKWKLFFVNSARAIACLAFLSVIFSGCANPGTEKLPVSAQTKPLATPPATQATQSRNDEAILVYHCQPGNGKPLSSVQATQLATLLANDKAAAFYHCQPFHCDQSAAFVDGRWLWKQTVPGDYEAIVAVAVDGSTNKVTVNLLNSTGYPLP